MRQKQNNIDNKYCEIKKKKSQSDVDKKKYGKINNIIQINKYCEIKKKNNIIQIKNIVR